MTGNGVDEIHGRTGDAIPCVEFAYLGLDVVDYVTGGLPCQESMRDMKTADLIEHVAAEHGVAKEHTKKILDSALAAVAAAARAGEEVTLAGFGRFKVTERAERQGRNPATGETITIAASKKLTFVAAKNIRDAMNTAAAAANRAPAPVESTRKRGSLSQKPSPKTSERKGRRQGRIEA